MLAVAAYWLAVLIRSQRYFPPLVLFVVGTIVTTANDTGPLIGSYGSCAAILFPSVAWLTMALVATVDPADRAVLDVNTGSPTRVVAGAALAVLGCGCAALAFGLSFPAVTGTHTITPSVVAGGAAAELCAVLCGIATGLVCSQLVFATPAIAVALAVVVILGFYLTPWVSPLHSALHIADRPGTPAHLLVSLSTLVGLSALLALAVITLVETVAKRRS